MRYDITRLVPLFILAVLLSAFSYADLSDYPDMFFESGDFDGYIVSGRDGTAMDVISQTLIATSLNAYAERPQRGITKLDDEVSIDNNLILIGNPCVNKLTAELMGNPSPCDKDFPADKAFIRYFENDGYVYVVIAGKDDSSTRKAAEYLANLEANRLKGTEVELTTPSPKEEVEEKNKDTQNNDVNDGASEDSEQTDDIEDNTTEDTDSGKTDSPKNDSVEEGENTRPTLPENQTDENKTIEPPIKPQRNVFAKIWRWFTGIFS